MHKWPDHVKQLVEMALEEDIGTGDITTNAISGGSQNGRVKMIARQDGILAGLGLAEYVLNQVSGKILFTSSLNDGVVLKEGMEIARIEGPLAPILRAERTMLNFLQRMCGIATRAHLFAERLKGTQTKILDTRKTVPGHRFLDKMAVRLGGGTNHRIGLYDRFLIKENHIRMADGIENAISCCLNYRKKYNMKSEIEIEVTNLTELDRVLAYGQVRYVMLDNMSFDNMKTAADFIRSVTVSGQRSCFSEASGNITLETVAVVAATGVDFISSGALTHSVQSLDISLLVNDR